MAAYTVLEICVREKLASSYNFRKKREQSIKNNVITTSRIHFIFVWCDKNNVFIWSSKMSSCYVKRKIMLTSRFEQVWLDRYVSILTLNLARRRINVSAVYRLGL